jgi:hypothetical protein
MLRCVAPVRTDVSEECRFLQERHGVTSQKMAFFDGDDNDDDNNNIIGIIIMLWI